MRTIKCNCCKKYFGREKCIISKVEDFWENDLKNDSVIIISNLREKKAQTERRVVGIGGLRSTCRDARGVVSRACKAWTHASPVGLSILAWLW